MEQISIFHGKIHSFHGDVPNFCGEHQVNLEKVDYVVVPCPFDEGPMHYVDGREVPTSGARIFKNRGRDVAMPGGDARALGRTQVTPGFYGIWLL